MKTIFIFLITISSISAHAMALYDCKSKQFSIQIQEENCGIIWNSIIAPPDSIIIMDNDSTLLDEMEIVVDSTAWFCTFQAPTDAIFPGGEMALNNYIIDNIDVSRGDSTIQVNSVSVFVQFTIDTCGDASNVSIYKSSHSTLDNEVIRVINAMPKWTPSYFRGKKIAMKYTLPIQIYLN